MNKVHLEEQHSDTIKTALVYVFIPIMLAALTTIIGFISFIFGSYLDMIVDFGGAKFYFERVQLENSDAVNLSDYIGEYYSDEISVAYQIFIENQKLFLILSTNHLLLKILQNIIIKMM